MKTAILILVGVFAAHANACPDFSGKFQHGESERMQVEQTGCTGFKITTRDISDPYTPPVVVEFTADGQRHTYGKIFVVAAFKTNFLEQLFYGNSTSSEKIGDPVHWSVQTDSSGYKNIFVDTIDETDGSILTEKIYIGLTK